MTNTSDKPNPLAVEEDFYIEILEPSPAQQRTMEEHQKDLEYFLEKLYVSMCVPQGMLGPR